MDQFVSPNLKRRGKEAGLSQERLVKKVETDVRTIDNGEVKTSSILEQFVRISLKLTAV